MPDAEKFDSAELPPELRLGAALRRAREDRHVSLRGLARRLYRAHSTLVEYERGHRLAPLEAVQAYERELGLVPGALVALYQQALVARVLGLKGLGSSVTTSEVVWQGLGARSIPLPTCLTGMGRVFVGREQEMEQLRQAWDEARTGEVRVALLSGEPGVGKSRLAAELAREAHDTGATVLAGRCDEDLGVPYQPFVEALRHFLDHTPDSDLTRHLGRYPWALVRLIPELTERVPGLAIPLRSDPETERYRLFDAVASWLTAIPCKEPLILVLDDLQWAAKPTLLLLRHVARSHEARRFLVLGTYRNTEVDRSHPLSELLADLRRSPGMQHISLFGLDASAVTVLLEQVAGSSLIQGNLSLARAIHEETEGNPFFVGEVARHLTETGAVHRQAKGWVTGLTVEEMGIPDGVRDVIGRRVSRLSELANRALTVAAVAGVEFDLDVVERVAGVSGDHLVAAFEEAVAGGLLVESRGRAVRYRFAHALVRDTLYDELSAARRVRLHRQVAEAIETIHAGRLADHLPSLAHHYARALTPRAETDKAVDYAARAGDRALAQLSHDEAAAYYGQAVDLIAQSSGDEHRRLELLILLGEAQRRAGDPSHRQTLLDAAHLAQELDDTDALARAALANNRGYYSVAFEVDAERVAMLEAALGAVGRADSAARARLLANLAVELAFASDNERRQELATEALAMARRLSDPTVLGHVLTTRYAIILPTAADEVGEYLIELDALAARLKDPALDFWAAVCGGISALIAGELEIFKRRLDAAERFAADLSQPSLRWIVINVRSNQARIAGELHVAEALAQETLELGTAAGMPDAFRVYVANLTAIRYDQRRLGDLLDLFERAVKRRAPNVGAELGFALALCELERYEEARRVFQALAENEFARIPRNFFWLHGVTMAAEVCTALGDTKQGAVLYDLLTPHHALVATTGSTATASVAHYLGLLATTMKRYVAADAHFTAAAEIHARMQAPVWLARTQVDWAQMLLTRRQLGDTGRARVLLGRARATAQQLNLGTVERRAVALLY